MKVLLVVSLLCLTLTARAQQTRYTVQLEALPMLNSALEKVKQLKAKGADAYFVKSQIRNKGTFYRVRIGDFPSQAQARKFGTDLQRRGIVSEFFIAVFERPQEDFESPAARVIGIPERTVPISPAKERSNSSRPSTSSSKTSFSTTRYAPDTSAREKNRESLSSTNGEAPIINYRGYIRGPRGGCYYINRNGNKTYVDRSLCGSAFSYSRPSANSREGYITGPRGGCYYINGNGNKTYVDRSYCR